MRWAVLLLIGAACTPDPRPAPDLHAGVPAVLLHRLPIQDPPDAPDVGPRPTRLGGSSATLAPDAWQPAEDPVAARFGLRLRASLPPEVEIRTARFAPPGLSVLADGEPIPWRVRPGSSEEPGYRLSDGAVLLAWPAGAPPARVDIVDRASLQIGLDPDRRPLRVGDVTLAGLRVRAGGAAAIDVPAAGELRATLTAMGGPVRLIGRSRGASVFDATLHPERLTEVRAAVPEGLLVLSAQGDPGALAFVGAPSIASPPPRPPRRIVWIGLDTLRPDHLGHRGYPRPTSPNLDAFAARATVFAGAVAPAPRTRPSFRSALTGLDPLGAVGAPDLLAHLGDAGFATAGFVANPHLDPLLGLGTGADRWELHLGARAAEQADRAIDWLRANAHHDAALFVHFMDPHLPYAAPEPDFERFAIDPDPQLPASLSRSDIVARMRRGELDPRQRAQLIARYDGEIAGLDRALGRLFSAIDALPGPNVVVVFSDHGEELWDRGGFEHNHSLAPEVVDAVMIVREPAQTRGQVIAGLVELADLLPTTRALLGLPPDAALRGRSLVEALRGSTLDERAVGIAHLMYGEERWAVRTARWSYALWTLSGREVLYDRVADPHELHPLTVDAATLDALRAELARVHDAEVGPGWRIAIELSEPVALRLPSRARAAGVIDPEAGRVPRANQVWGERPPLSPDDVATVTLSSDGRTLTITPGRAGRGHLWVRNDGDEPAGEVVSSRGITPIDATGHADLGPAGTLRVAPGTVVVPPASEIERLRALGASTATTPAHHIEALRALGYLDAD